MTECTWTDPVVHYLSYRSPGTRTACGKIPSLAPLTSNALEGVTCPACAVEVRCSVAIDGRAIHWRLRPPEVVTPWRRKRTIQEVAANLRRSIRLVDRTIASAPNAEGGELIALRRDLEDDLFHMELSLRMLESEERDAVETIVALPLSESIDPAGFFVYCLWGPDDTVPLYVGQSMNILARLGTHMIDADKRAMVKRITLLRCPTATSMTATENRLIAHYQPILNRAGIRSLKRA